MHNFKLFSLGLMASVAIAIDSSPLLFSRQVEDIPCSQVGQKACGSGCIPLTDTCCPQQQGGCPASQYCVVGSNGLDGCCDIGETCEGRGGTNTNLEIFTSTSTSSSTRTSRLPSETTRASTSAEAAASSSISRISSVEIPPARTSSSNASATKPPVEFTPGSDGSLVATSSFHVLGALFAAFFVF